MIKPTFTEHAEYLETVELRPGTAALLVQFEHKSPELHWHEHHGGTLDDLSGAYLRMGYTIPRLHLWSHTLSDSDRTKLRRAWEKEWGQVIEATSEWEGYQLTRIYGVVHVAEDGSVFKVAGMEQPNPPARPLWIADVGIARCEVFPFAMNIEQIRERFELWTVEEAFDAWMARCERSLSQGKPC